MMKAMNCNKEEVINRIMQNQDILKCLYYTDNSIDILEQPDITSSADKRLIRQKFIYPYKRLPLETTDTQETYISIEYGEIYYMQEGTNYKNVKNPYWKKTYLHLYVISHASLDCNTMIGSRIDTIEEALHETFHKKMVVNNLGQSFLFSSSPLALPKEFIGRDIILDFKESGFDESTR